MPPEVLLLYRIVLDILGFLLFHMKLSTVLSRSLKNFAGHSVESVLVRTFNPRTQRRQGQAVPL